MKNRPKHFYVSGFTCNRPVGWVRMLSLAAGIALANPPSIASANEAIVLFAGGTPAKALVPSNASPNLWTDPNFDDSSWSNVTTGVGFAVTNCVRILLADSVAQFSGTQGQANWFYGYYNRSADLDATYDATKFVPFPNMGNQFGPSNFWDGTSWNWYNGHPPWTEIGDGFMHPNGTNNGAEHWPVRRWVSTASGLAEVDWHLAKQDLTGLGVRGHVFQNGTELAAATIAGQDGAGVELRVVIRLAAGDHIDFALDPAGLNNDRADTGDQAFFTALIFKLPELAGLIQSNIETQMYGVNASMYLRIPFKMADVTNVQSLILRMKYNDGFVAYLNGGEIARRNAPQLPDWNSAATNARSDAEATQFEDILLQGASPLLQEGTNVLALQGLNVNAADCTFLILPELRGNADIANQPVAGPDNLGTVTNMPVSMPLVYFLQNDQSSLGDPVALLAMDSQGAQGGTITLASASPNDVSSEQIVTYAPPLDFSGTDSFAYSITNANSAATGVVNVVVVAKPPGGRAVSIGVVAPNGFDPPLKKIGVTFETIPWRHYGVQHSPDMDEWATATDDSGSSNGTLHIEEFVPVAKAGFYRLELKPMARYSIITIDSRHGAASGVNSSCEVVGYLNFDGGRFSHAFYWRPDTNPKLLDLGTLGGSLSGATGIDAYHNVVGYASPPGDFPSHAFVWDSINGMRDLGTLGGITSAAWAINSKGVATGYGADGGGYAHAFLWDESGGIRSITGAGNGTWAWAINDFGVVVGSYRTALGIGTPYPPQALGWEDDGTQFTITNAPGGMCSMAFGINLNRQAVGIVCLGKENVHAFAWNKTAGMRVLDSLGWCVGGLDCSRANAINLWNNVVGYAIAKDARRHAVIWQKDKISDLNDLIPKGTEWLYLQEATAINNLGCIVGNGEIKGLEYGYGTTSPFLLIPTFLSSLSVSPQPVTGGAGATVKITLSDYSPMPLEVNLKTTGFGGLVSLPGPTILIPRGKKEVTFPIYTSTVSVPHGGTISASFGGWTVKGDLSLQPP